MSDDAPPPDDQSGRPQPKSDPALKFWVPLNTSALALISGYLGLVSVLCVPAPLALLFGLLALWHLNRNPHLGGRGRANFAIVMGAIFSVVLVVAMMSVPMLVPKIRFGA